MCFRISGSLVRRDEARRVIRGWSCWDWARLQMLGVPVPGQQHSISGPWPSSWACGPRHWASSRSETELSHLVVGEAVWQPLQGHLWPPHPSIKSATMPCVLCTSLQNAFLVTLQEPISRLVQQTCLGPVHVQQQNGAQHREKVLHGTLLESSDQLIWSDDR